MYYCGNPGNIPSSLVVSSAGSGSTRPGMANEKVAAVAKSASSVRLWWRATSIARARIRFWAAKNSIRVAGSSGERAGPLD